LEAHRSGLSIHRVAQIFRERGVDISVPHLVRTVRRFVDEEERTAGKGSSAQRPAESAAAEATKSKAQVTSQVSEQPSTRVQEEEFAKQLRLARYLAASSLPPARTLGPVRQPRRPKKERPIAKTGTKTKPERSAKKAREDELAKERRQARRVGQKVSSAGSGGGEKQRPERGR
jgi:hypothetical protein